MERSIVVEYGKDQVGAQICIEFGSSFIYILQVCLTREYDQSSSFLGNQGGACIQDTIQLAGGCLGGTEYTSSPVACKGTSQRRRIEYNEHHQYWNQKRLHKKHQYLQFQNVRKTIENRQSNNKDSNFSGPGFSQSHIELIDYNRKYCRLRRHSEIIGGRQTGEQLHHSSFPFSRNPIQSAANSLLPKSYLFLRFLVIHGRSPPCLFF